VLGLLLLCGTVSAASAGFGLACALGPSHDRQRHALNAGLAAVVSLVAWAQAHSLALLTNTFRAFAALEQGQVTSDAQPFARLTLSVGLALSLGAVAATMRQGAISMMGPTLATVALVTVGGSSALGRVPSRVEK
jgi:energy-converting hydrogenase Eha subunit E